MSALPDSPTARPKVAGETASTSGGRVLVTLFLLTVCLSVPFDVGSVQLYTARAFFLILFIPLVFMWLAGAAGRITLPDAFFALHAFWIFIALMANHGMTQIPFAAASVIEIFGAYLLGRMAIRSLADYRHFFRLHLFAMILLFPFALLEMYDGSPVMQEIMRSVTGRSYIDINHPPRLGLWRVQSVFQHPILFGVFCSIGIANGFYLLCPKIAKGLLRGGFSLFMTFTSLSSGPFLAGVTQIGLIVWGGATKNKWKLLAWLSLAMYIFLSIASDRGPIRLIVETLTFNSGSGWTRILQYIHGIEEVKSNPIVGIGLNDWNRPYWLGSSVDNFWLLTAMRYGVVGFGFLAIAVATNLRAVIKASLENVPERNARLGYVVGLVSLILTLATVHIWSQVSLVVMFYFGAGAWMFTGGATPAATEEVAARKEDTGPARRLPARAPRAAPDGAAAARHTSRYTRYGPRRARDS